MFKGYRNSPKGPTDGFDHLGFFDTGDMAIVDRHGYITVVDRAKDMVLTGGENVYSTEVENALASHPAVAHAAVFGLPHPVLGETVTAGVVLRTGAAAQQRELVAHCAARLAGYKVPFRVLFFEEFPMTASGKVGAPSSSLPSSRRAVLSFSSLCCVSAKEDRGCDPAFGLSDSRFVSIIGQVLKRVLRQRAEAMLSGRAPAPAPAPAPPKPAPAAAPLAASAAGGRSAAPAAAAAPQPRMAVADMAQLYEVKWAPRAESAEATAAAASELVRSSSGSGSGRSGGRSRSRAPKRIWLVCGGDDPAAPESSDATAKALAAALGAAGQPSEEMPVSALLDRSKEAVAALSDTLRNKGSVTLVMTWPLSLSAAAAASAASESAAVAAGGSGDISPAEVAAAEAALETGARLLKAMGAAAELGSGGGSSSGGGSPATVLFLVRGSPGLAADSAAAARSDAVSAAVSGLVRSAQATWPRLRLALVGVDARMAAGAELAAQILPLGAAAQGEVLALPRAGAILTPTLSLVPAPPPPVIGPGGVAAAFTALGAEMRRMGAITAAAAGGGGGAGGALTAASPLSKGGAYAVFGGPSHGPSVVALCVRWLSESLGADTVVLVGSAGVFAGRALAGGPGVGGGGVGGASRALPPALANLSAPGAVPSGCRILVLSADSSSAPDLLGTVSAAVAERTGKRLRGVLAIAAAASGPVTPAAASGLLCPPWEVPFDSSPSSDIVCASREALRDALLAASTARRSAAAAAAGGAAAPLDFVAFAQVGAGGAGGALLQPHRCARLAVAAAAAESLAVNLRAEGFSTVSLQYAFALRPHPSRSAAAAAILTQALPPSGGASALAALLTAFASSVPAALMPALLPALAAGGAAGATPSGAAAGGGISKLLALVQASVDDALGGGVGGGGRPPDTSFSELGLTSMLAMQVVSSLEAALGTQLPATLAFDYPSVAQMAAHISTILPRDHPAAAAAATAADVAGGGGGVGSARSPGAAAAAARLAVRRALAAVLGREDIDDSAPLMREGLTSIGAVALHEELQRATGLELSATVCFDYPTAAELVAHVASLLHPGATAAAAAAAQQPQAAARAAARSGRGGEAAASKAAAKKGGGAHPSAASAARAAVQRAVSEILGRGDFDGAAPLMREGLTSIGAVALHEDLQRATGLELAPTLAFDFPTADALTEHIAALLPAGDGDDGDDGGEEDESTLAGLELAAAQSGAALAASAASAASAAGGIVAAILSEARRLPGGSAVRARVPAAGGGGGGFPSDADPLRSGVQGLSADAVSGVPLRRWDAEWDLGNPRFDGLPCRWGSFLKVNTSLLLSRRACAFMMIVQIVCWSADKNCVLITFAI